jgi:small subunit ribosomal protein S8
MMTDPIADMLTRIRNAGRAGHTSLACPSSRLKAAVAHVLSTEGFVGPVKLEGDGHRSRLVIDLRYRDSGAQMIDGIRRISKPGRRVFVGATEIPKVRNGLGIAVLSTSRGVMSDRDARAANVGGELLCEVW